MTMSRALDAFCLKQTYAQGAASATQIAITGITSEDIIISVIENTSAAVKRPNDVTAYCTISGTAGYIYCSKATTTATGNWLQVLWADVSM